MTKAGREAKTGIRAVVPGEDSEVKWERISEGKSGREGTVSYGYVNISGAASGTQTGCVAGLKNISERYVGNSLRNE